MRSLILIMLFTLVSCLEGPVDEVKDKLDDSFSNTPKPQDKQVSPICYEDFHKIEASKTSRKLDILVVIDTSGSIKEERSRIAKGFDNLTRSLPENVDYNIGVLLAHGDQSVNSGRLYKKNHDPRVLKSSELSIEQIKEYLDLKIYKPKEDGQTDGGEMGMLSLLNALKPENLSNMKAEGLFRDDAALAVVFIADEQDICAKAPEGVTFIEDRQNKERMSFVKYCIEENIKWKDVVVGGRDYTYKITPEMVITRIREVQGDNPLVIGGVLYDEDSVLPGNDEDEIGYGYREMIALADGINVDLANGDYGDGLTKLGRLATAKMELENSFPVKNDYIDPLTLSASVDDDQIQAYYEFEFKKIFIDPSFDQLGIVKLNYCSDSTLPVINIESISQYTDNSNLRLRANIDELYFERADLYLNNNLFLTVQEKVLDELLPLNEGLNEIRIEAFDKVGNKKIEETNIILDTIAPVLTMSREGEVFVGGNELSLLGSIEEANLDRYEIYVNTALYKTGNTLEINEDVPLPLNQNTVTVTAFDKLNRASNQIVINAIVDNQKPVVSLTTEDNQRTNNSSFNLDYSIMESNLLNSKILVNGVFIKEEIGNSVSTSITLVEGQNNIEIIAQDQAGNLSDIVQLNGIELDTTAPILSDLRPLQNSILRTTMIKVQGSSNEALSEVLINDDPAEISTDKLSFNLDRTEQGEGSVILDIIAKDDLGNTATYQLNYEIFLKLIRIELVTLMEDNGKIKIIGLEGAAYGGLEIDISGGFFNSTTIVARENGSFEAMVDYSTSVSLKAENSQFGLSESYSLSYDFDTTLSGIVKDVNDTPIPGVNVTIASSGQSSTTDSNGVFNILNPVTGDQRIIIDGTSVSEDFTMGKKIYSSLSINYSVGLNERNILERAIYLAPIMLDGSETIIEANQGTIVTSVHAPGVELDIPADAVNFPVGTSNTINMMEIPVDKTSIEIFEGARPDTVTALEPSGLNFTEPVKLTLPNPNEFEEGTRLVIMSKNSSTGLWEIDGSAEVSGGVIETLDGQGITHFSEVFAAPYGLDVTPMVGENSVRPGFDSSKGSLTTQAALPSYKTFGSDFTPSLVYKSSWANPNVLISNVFNLANYQILRGPTDLQTNLFGISRVSGKTEVWTTPEYIKSKFYSGSIESEELQFNTESAPETGIVSYAMDLETLPSGIYPARSSYEIKYKQFIKSTTKVVQRGIFGKKTRWIRENQIAFNTVFPKDLKSNLLVQNKKESEYGQGWKLGLTQNILNPGDDRLLIEEASGETNNYILNNSIDTVVVDNAGIKAFNYNENIYYVNNMGQSYRTTINSNQIIQEPRERIDQYNAQIGINVAYRYRGVGYCRGWIYPLNDYKNISQTLFSPNGNHYYLDQFGAFYSMSSGIENVISGEIKEIPNYQKYTTLPFTVSDINSPCQEVIGRDCNDADLLSPVIRDNIYFQPSSASWGSTCGPIEPFSPSLGTFPSMGYKSSSLLESKFNDPQDFTPSKIEGNVFYIADTGNNLIRKVNIANNLVSDFAGNQGTIDPNDQQDTIYATNMTIYHPRGVIADNQGNIYISSENGLIRRVDSNGIIYIIAGKNKQAGPVEVNTLDKVSLDMPSGMALDEDKAYLYVADTGNNRIVRLDLNNNSTQQIAGNTLCASGPDNVRDGNPALEVSLCSPKKIALDKDKNLLILDKANNRIRRIKFNASAFGVSTYASAAQDNSTITRNSDGSFSRSYRSGNMVLFNSDGQQIKTIDRLGNEIDFVYEDNLLSQIVDNSGRSSNLNYSSGLLSSFTDPSGRTTNFYYNGDSQLEEIRYPDGTSKQFFYDSLGLMTSEINQRGHQTAYVYNEWNRLKEVIRQDNTKTVVGETIIDTLANDYVGGDVGELRNYSEDANDSNELAQVFTNAKGYTSEFTQDLQGYVSKITDAKDRETLIERDLQARPIKITRPDNSYTEFTYNDLGDLIVKYDSSTNRTEKYSYNSLGNLLNYVDYRNKTRSNIYDVDGNLIQEIDFNGVAFNKSYYPNGLLKTTSNQYGQTTTYEYDQNGNLNKRISHSGDITEYFRDFAGNIVEKKDARNISTKYTYDDFNRLLTVETGISSSNPVGDITSYQYDEAGNLKKIIDPKGNQTAFVYDTLNRLRTKTTYLGQVTELDYDGNGNVVYEKDPNGNVKTYVYDEIDQLISKSLPDNNYSISYDENGNMTQIMDADSELLFDYEKIGDEYYVKESISAGLDMPEVTLTYSYDDLGNRITMNTPYGGFGYTYDDGSRLRNINNHKSENYSIDYDSANRISKLTRPGSYSNFIYDGTNFLNSMIHYKTSGSQINGFNYGRDGIGNRTTKLSAYGTNTYSYDEKSQLKTASNPEADSDYLNEVFTYDELGNRIGDQNGNYSYDNKSQRLIEDYKYLYSYDNNGNLTSRQEKGFNGNLTNYVYSSENQLIKVEEFESGNLIKRSIYAYDALGRRMKKEVEDFTNSANSLTRKYIYDGDEILAEHGDSNSVLAVYTHSTLRTDDVIAVDIQSTQLANSTGSYQYLKDALGSITDIVNNAGGLIQHYAYSSFGKILKIKDGNGNDVTASPVVKTSYSFTGREYDSESGMYYYRARYYMPEIGRFISEDPHPGKLAAPMTYNTKYAYASNNPTNMTDPTGLFSIGGFVEGFFQGLGDILNSEVARVVLIVAAAVVTGGAAAAVLGTGFWGTLVGSIAGGLVGGEVGAWHANLAGEGKEGISRWRNNGRIIGGYVGGVSAAANGFGIFDSAGRSPASLGAAEDGTGYINYGNNGFDAGRVLHCLAVPIGTALFKIFGWATFLYNPTLAGGLVRTGMDATSSVKQANTECFGK